MEYISRNFCKTAAKIREKGAKLEFRNSRLYTLERQALMPHLKSIYNPQTHPGPMNVVCFGSGSGTTIEAILAEEKRLEETQNPLFKVRAILVNKECRSREVAKDAGLPLIYNDRVKFFRQRGVENLHDKATLQEYDKKNLKDLESLCWRENFSLDLIALAGYWMIVEAPLFEAFSDKIINSHPADLACLDEKGSRKYKGIYGADAIYQALIAQEKYTKTCIHIVTPQVDEGELLVSSKPLEFIEEVNDLMKITNPEIREKTLKVVSRYHQELQKRVCDYPAYLAALKMIGQGRIALNEERKVYIDGVYHPRGYQLA